MCSFLRKSILFGFQFQRYFYLLRIFVNIFFPSAGTTASITNQTTAAAINTVTYKLVIKIVIKEEQEELLVL